MQRLSFPTLDRPKAAAKWLARQSDNVTLTRAQQAVAHAVGYRDWYELSGSNPTEDIGRAADLDHAKRVVLAVADDLDLPIGDVQFAISKSRLLGSQPPSLAEMLQLRAMLWRERLFGPSGRGKPGTVVRVKSPGENGFAYFKGVDRATHLIFDTGPGLRANTEVITSKLPLPDFVPSRLWLPYGFWTLTDGSTVIFSRDNVPMWKVAGGQTERLEPWTTIQGWKERAYFPEMAGAVSWSSGSARSLAIGFLEAHRIFEPPKLLDVMPYLFKPDVSSVGVAVGRMEEERVAVNV